MKNITKIIALIMVLVLCVGVFTGCAEDPEKAAKAAVNEIFVQIENRDFLQALGAFDEAVSEEDWTKSEDFLDAIFENMEYTIGEAEVVDEETVNVNVSITNIDMEKVFEKYIQDVFSLALSSDMASMTDEEMETKSIEMLVDCMKSEDVTTKTFDVVAVVEKTEEGWEVSPEDTFINALLGGLYDAAESLNSLGQ